MRERASIERDRGDINKDQIPGRSAVPAAFSGGERKPRTRTRMQQPKVAVGKKKRRIESREEIGLHYCYIGPGGHG